MTKEYLMHIYVGNIIERHREAIQAVREVLT